MEMCMPSAPTDHWSTPWWLFEPLDKKYNFSIDAAANSKNAKLPNYFTEEQNALEINWHKTAVASGLAPRFWINPPYSRKLILPFMEKIIEEWNKGCFIVALVKTDSSTIWWHKCAMKANQMIFLKKRVMFQGASNGANFPSTLLVYNPDQPAISPTVSAWWPEEAPY